MMLHRTGRLLVILMLLFAGKAWASDPLTSLFDKIATAYGTTAPAAIRETGSMTTLRKGNGVLLRLYRFPDHFRSAIKYDSGIEVRTMIGKQAWMQDQPASGALRGAIALQKARVGLPWNMLAETAVQDLGTIVDVNGKVLQAIEVPLEKGLKMVVDVEPETGYIVRCRGQVAVDSGKTLEFTTVYSNFQTQQGRVHAMIEKHFIMNMSIGQSTIETIDYPTTLSEDAFNPSPAESVGKEI